MMKNGSTPRQQEAPATAARVGYLTTNGHSYSLQLQLQLEAKETKRLPVGPSNCSQAMSSQIGNLGSVGLEWTILSGPARLIAVASHDVGSLKRIAFKDMF
jgi:hypothetical protein